MSGSFTIYISDLVATVFSYISRIYFHASSSFLPLIRYWQILGLYNTLQPTKLCIINTNFNGLSWWLDNTVKFIPVLSALSTSLKANINFWILLVEMKKKYSIIHQKFTVFIPTKQQNRILNFTHHNCLPLSTKTVSPTLWHLWLG